MTQIQWDVTGERTYESGVDHGVLYLPNAQGVYDTGYAWNGLTTVTESPSGAEASPQYADNIKYINLVSAEDFGATFEAFTYPRQFAVCDGTAVVNGVRVGQQARKTFGASYRTLVGNDLAGQRAGYKIHLVYGALAAPSEKAYGTLNDSPEPINFSWEVSTTPTNVGTINGVTYAPTALLVIDSTTQDAADMAVLEAILYGTAGQDPRLPSPAEVIALFDAGSIQVVNLAASANQPSYNSGTHVVTLPAVTGVQWKINGVNKSAGAQPALSSGQNALVEAVAQTGYAFSANSVTRWSFDY